MLLLLLPMVRRCGREFTNSSVFKVFTLSLKCRLVVLGPPKTEAQLKKEAKKREKLEKFQQKKEMEAKKKMQPVTEVWMFLSLMSCDTTEIT